MNNDSVLVFLYYNGSIVEGPEGATFASNSTTCFYIDNFTSYDDLVAKVTAVIPISGNQYIRALTYRCPISCDRGSCRYRLLSVSTDVDVKMMFAVHQQYPEIRLIELLADVQSISFEGASLDPMHNFLQSSLGAIPVETIPSASFQPSTESTPPIRSRQATMSRTSSSPVHHDDGREADEDNVEGDGDDSCSSNSSDRDSYDLEPQMEDVEGLAMVPFVPPSHLTALSLEAMDVPEWPEYPELYLTAGVDTSNVEEFRVGMQFLTLEDVKTAIKSYSLRRSVEYKVVDSEPRKYAGKCKYFGNGCLWRIRVTFMVKKQVWEVRKYDGPHTCTTARNTTDHSKLDSDIICKSIIPLVIAKSTVSVPILIGHIYSKFNYRPSYRKTWLGKQKAIARIYGDWEGSYNELPKWMKAMKQVMPEMKFKLETLPYHDDDNILIEGKQMFHRLFWTFPSCVEAFPHCKPIVQIDGTHLYGKYKGVLLIATTQDGNRNIVPIAFAIVESETIDGWKFFLSRVRRYVTPQNGICFISDRSRAILGAFTNMGPAMQPPNVYHVFCIRHIATNFMGQFGDKVLKRVLINAAYAKCRADFNHWYGILRSENAAAAQWIDGIERWQWAQVSDSGSRRYGHMTTNLSECVNSVLKGARSLPITALVKATYFRLAKLFVTREELARARLEANQVYADKVVQVLLQNQEASKICCVDEFNRAELKFYVREVSAPAHGIARSYRVELNAGTCQCGEFQAYRYPCRHVIAACDHIRMAWTPYVDRIYKVETLLKVYEKKLEPVHNEAHWLPYNGPIICENKSLRRNPNGRPKSTRIRNEMDAREPGQQKRCGLCRGAGHSRNRCPNRASGSN